MEIGSPTYVRVREIERERERECVRLRELGAGECMDFPSSSPCDAIPSDGLPAIHPSSPYRPQLSGKTPFRTMGMWTLVGPLEGGFSRGL